MDTHSAQDEQYFNYAEEEEENHDKRFFDSADDNDESITGLSSASSCTDDANYDPDGQQQQHNYSFSSYDFERSQNFVIDSHDGDDDGPSYSTEEGSWDEDDDSLGFPPGYITTLEEMHEFSSNSNNISSIDSSSSSSSSGEKKSSVNPSIIPSYFFCPLTETIMKDPVITPDGTTFERRSILRWLILQPCNPITGTPLSHVDLVDDHLVRTSIDKARKEAWIRYVVEFRDDDAEKVYEEKVVEKEKEQRGRIMVDSSLVLDEVITREESSEQLLPALQRNDGPEAASSTDDKVSLVSATLNATIDPGQRNHGWLVPLGVHTIVCSSPGLIVTTDVHRRSKAVKRRKLRKSLAGGGKSIDQKKKKKSIKKRIGNAVSPRKQRRTEREEYERRLNNIKITTTAITEDLILPPGAHVEISETRIHGGRVRGKINWEEEVTVELDADLVEEMKRQEEIVEMMAKVRVSPSKKKVLFRRKQDKQGRRVGEDAVVAQTVPYSSHLSSNEIPPPSPRQQKKSRSPSPLTTIKYSGWISLQWAGLVGNFEKDEALKRRRKTINMLKEDEVSDYRSHLIADEDDGPWSRSLPLGVYQIGNDNLSVFESPEASSNPIGTLKSGDVVEVVETKVVLMKKRVSESQGLSMLTSDFEVVRTVRARCMMSSGDNAPKKRFKSGWITLSEEGKSETASPIPVGAHVVSSKEPLVSYSGTQIKSILPSGSCMEVDATRLEFDESETVKCACGQESAYPVIAVKALISLGGYATLFTHPVGKSNPCACGKELVTGQRQYANPVELGVYKIIEPGGVFLTEGIGPNTPIVTTLKQDACVEVVETRVEEGCVRGKINVFLSCDLSEMGDKSAGWISLFEPPSFVWAEIVSKKR